MNDYISFERKEAVKANEVVRFKLGISDNFGFVEKLELKIFLPTGRNIVLQMNYMNTQNKISHFETEYMVTEIGINYYFIQGCFNGCKKEIKFDSQNGKPTIQGGAPWKITVYENDFCVPEWASEVLIYQIFCDRFAKGEEYTPELIADRVILNWGEMPVWKPDQTGDIRNVEYFQGNLIGIVKKLEYLKELGTEIIYLSPICKSQSSHRYDTGDYEMVDPYLGDNEALKNLCKEIHAKGMRIILDAVFNHTGNDSRYFNEYGTYSGVGACQGMCSPYYEWYKGEYWWGFKNLPVCDGNNRNWREYIVGPGGVIDLWFSLGIDGLRLDVADELTDDFIEEIRIAVKRNKEDGFVIGEVWENAVQKEKNGDKRKYLLGKGMDSVMNYPYTNAILKYIRFGDVKYFRNTVEEILLEYPEPAIYTLMNSLSTHDINRAMTTLAGEGIDNNHTNIWDVNYDRNWQYHHDNLGENYDLAKKRLKLASIIQYFLPGNPCLFYGDEAGLCGYKDPFNRKCFPWGDEDKELLDFFKELAKARKVLKELNKSKYNLVFVDSNLLLFERSKGDSGVLIAVNRSGYEQAIQIPSKYLNGTICFSLNSSYNKILPYGAIIIRR